MNIELYIAGQLCDLEKADLGIRLRRQLFNPKELSTKDSQKSYSITLPATPRNNEIFQHKNVEETVGKFTLYPDARLYVNNILIMEGKFRLSEISAEGYKGNLGVPAPLTAKDVFGERKMNDINPWIIDFKGEESLTEYNTTLKDDGSLRECIFPLVLYGLLPDTNTPTIKDDTEFSLYDFPPSVNCMQMLDKIFKSAKYTLNGSALEDDRLKSLYLSYKNPEDYPLPFEVKRTEFSAKWTNWDRSGTKNQMEKQISVNTFPDGYNYIIDNKENTWNGGEGFVVCNLFNSDNLDKISVIADDSHHLKISNNNQVSYKVPNDGLYRIDLDATIFFKNDVGNLRAEHEVNGKTVYVVNRTFTGHSDYLYRSFENVACELKLIRHSDSSLDLSSIAMDNMFSRNNQDQNNTEEGVLNPKAYFPLPGSVNFVDAAQNKDFLCGFSWGRMTSHNGNWTRGERQNYALVEFENPLWKEDKQYIAHPMAIKHGRSWIENGGISEEEKSHSAVYSPGYRTVDVNNQPIEPDINRYKIDLDGAQAYARLKDSIQKGTNYSYVGGEGRIQQMVWLRAGENISLIATQNRSNRLDWIHQEIEFTLSIEPFRLENSWLTMHDSWEESNSSSAPMYWNDTAGLLRGQIDLSKFLPKEVKIDDWITNFCKAFNLELLHTNDKSFALNVKERNIVKNTSLVIDLDSKVNVKHVNNETLALPRTYKLGFTTDTAEEGYVASIKEGKGINEGYTGGGVFDTGSNENNQVEQTSNFSYCWYKTLDKEFKENGTTKTKQIDVPVISDHEIWSEEGNYNELQTKTYFNKAQRFWYHSGDTEQLMVYSTPADIAKVSERYEGKKNLWLNYEDKPDSILREYFTLLTNDKEYTCVECYLTPEEYEVLDRAYVRFNGDVYNVVDADGFDPSGKEKTKLKLIKRI